MQYIFFGLVVLVYGLLNFYIGLRGLQSINAKIPVNKVAYWIIIFVFSSMYFVGMLGKNHLPERVERIFITIGGYWLAAFIYLLGFVVIIDIIRLLDKKLNIIPGVLKNNSWFIATLVVAIVAVTMAIGAYNAVVPKVVEYNIGIDKKAGNIKELKCAMISDVHLGELIGRDRLHTAVKIINSLNPDIVFIPGDLIDRELEPVVREKMLDEIKSLKPKYGIYAVLGNHEYYTNTSDKIVQLYENSGITVLRDKYVKVQDSFYLVGREDRTSNRYGYNRKKLVSLLEGVDKKLPVIVLDHQPQNLDEPRANGVDLQLSGHTHAGQFFPISIATRIIFEDDHGYLKNGKFNLIVSSGYGTWGPKVRIGSQSEVVDINLSFAG